MIEPIEYCTLQEFDDCIIVTPPGLNQIIDKINEIIEYLNNLEKEDT